MPGVSWQGDPPPAAPEIRQRLQAHVRHLAETIGPRNLSFYPALEATVEYLQGQLESCGYQVNRLSFKAEGALFHNLETDSGPGPSVVVGAHYDSVLDCPGANDNASGVAAVLELARLLAGVEGVRFVLFPNEEPPFYRTEEMGSVRYVRQLSPFEVRFMVCLETVGYYVCEPDSQRAPFPGVPDVGDFVAFVGNSMSAPLVQRLVGRWRERVAFPSLGVAATDFSESFLLEAGMGMSDHASFWAAGIPAVMVTDTVFYRYDHYHELSDTWEKLTYEPFARMVEGLALTLRGELEGESPGDDPHQS